MDTKGNILLVCSGLEPGKDGVGDYCRTLGHCFMEAQYGVCMIALNDSHINAITKEHDHGITIIRLPKNISWNEKEQIVQKTLVRIDPVWASLHLVVFGLNQKGIIHNSIAPMTRLFKKYPIHLMLHELWIGEQQGSTIKERLWGKVIKYYLIQLIKKLKPIAIFVNCKVNQYLLAKEQILSTVAPVFSNIAVHPIGDMQPYFGRLMQNHLPTLSTARNDYFVAGFFGSIHPEWNFSEALMVCQKFAHAHHQKLLLFFFGKMNVETVASITNTLNDDNYSVNLGTDTEASISHYIQCCDVGITSNPSILIEKSGSIAAFWLHQKPVLVSRYDVFVKGFDPTMLDCPLLLSVADIENNKLETINKSSYTSKLTKNAVADLMVESMQEYN